MHTHMVPPPPPPHCPLPTHTHNGRVKQGKHHRWENTYMTVASTCRNMHRYSNHIHPTPPNIHTQMRARTHTHTHTHTMAKWREENTTNGKSNKWQWHPLAEISNNHIHISHTHTHPSTHWQREKDCKSTNMHPAISSIYHSVLTSSARCGYTGHDAFNLIERRWTRKQRFPQQHFSQNTSQTPHIHTFCVPVNQFPTPFTPGCITDKVLLVIISVNKTCTMLTR